MLIGIVLGQYFVFGAYVLYCIMSLKKSKKEKDWSIIMFSLSTIILLWTFVPIYS